MIQEYIAVADTKYVAASPQLNIASTTWGSQANPKIIYVDASQAPAKISGNVVGYGVLVVKGRLEVAGTLNFFGLVIPFNASMNDSTVFNVHDSTTFTSNGTINIIGLVLMLGKAGSDFIMNGSAKIYYSSEALDDAQNIGKLQFYRILSWYE